MTLFDIGHSAILDQLRDLHQDSGVPRLCVTFCDVVYRLEKLTLDKIDLKN